MNVFTMRAIISILAFILTVFGIKIEASHSFDALIKFDNITAIWRNKKKSDQLYLVYLLNGAKVRYDLSEENLRYFCWISPEKHTEEMINDLPLISGEKIEIGISSERNRSNHNANHIDKNLHIFQLAQRQKKLILGVNQIPFAKLVLSSLHFKIILLQLTLYSHMISVKS
jgi:hypothetical protein